MLLRNEGSWDRAVRIVAGILFVAGAWAMSSSVLGLVLLVAGVVALATGLIGWCPLYAACRVSTLKAPTAQAGRRAQPGHV
jgi:hypothetical protein